MKLKSLKSVALSNPKFTKEQIKFIITHYLRIIDYKINENDSFKLVIPNFGKIHTRGNARNKKKDNNVMYVTEFIKKKRMYSDKTLLF